MVVRGGGWRLGPKGLRRWLRAGPAMALLGVLVGVGGAWLSIRAWQDARAEEMFRERTDRARRAFEAARQWWLAFEEYRVDQTWLLMEMLERRPDPMLEKKVAKERERLTPHSAFSRLLDPELPPHRVDPSFEMPKSGPWRVLLFMGASFVEPEEKGLELLREFMAYRGTEGYALTHQLVMLVQWEHMGRQVPPDMEARRSEVIDAIRREQASDDTFSDLYAERAMLLAMYGDEECPEELGNWVDVIVAAQKEDGSWGAPESTVELGSVAEEDHENNTVTFRDAGHTAVLAFATLQAYLLCTEEASPT